MANMKKSLLVIVVLILLMGVTVNGNSSDNVKDNLDVLLEREIGILQEKINEIKVNYSQEAVIVLVNTTDGKSSMAYADDYFDDNGYGVGSNHSGILMLVNMEARELWISTTGDSITTFTDSRIDTMVAHGVEYLGEGDYYGACRVFLKDVEKYIVKDQPKSFSQRIIRNLKIPYIYIGALVITLIVIVIITLSSRGKITVTNRTYENANSFKLTSRIDRYLYETTTRRKIEKQSSSGGSSTHTGSSGRSHGGGGGSF